MNVFGDVKLQVWNFYLHRMSTREEINEKFPLFVSSFIQNSSIIKCFCWKM